MSDPNKFAIIGLMFLIFHYLCGFIRMGILLNKPMGQQPLLFAQGKYGWFTPFWVHFIDMIVYLTRGKSIVPKLSWWILKSLMALFVFKKIVFSLS